MQNQAQPTCCSAVKEKLEGKAEPKWTDGIGVAWDGHETGTNQAGLCQLGLPHNGRSYHELLSLKKVVCRCWYLHTTDTSLHHTSSGTG